MSSNPYSLLIFDWDGTLLDSIASIVGCTQTTLEELEIEPVEEARIRGAIGLGIRETVEHLAPGCDDELFHRIREVYRRHWFATYSRRPVLFAGVKRTLRQLAGRGYLLAVATAKGRKGLLQDLAATGLADLFQATRTMDEAPSKPDPRMLLDILEELDVEARDALMIGDTTYDLEMAANAGIAAVAVSTGSHSRATLDGAGALDCLGGVTELVSWLDRRAARAALA